MLVGRRRTGERALDEGQRYRRVAVRPALAALAALGLLAGPAIPLARAAPPGEVLLGSGYRLEHLELSGNLALDRRGARPRLTGRLQLDLLATDLEREAESAESDGLLDARPPWELLERLDGYLQLSIERADVGRFLLRRVEGRLGVEEAKLTLDAAGKAQGGPMSLHLGVDAGQHPPGLVLNADLDDAQVAHLVQGGKATGTFEGHTRLRGQGWTLRELVSHMTGTLRLGAGEGVIEAPPLGPLGRDLFQIFVSQIDRSEKRTLYCAALHAEVEEGVGPVGVVLDAGQSTLGGSGIVDLPGWRADLVIRPRPKKPSVGAFKTPIRIKGPLDDLSARLDAAALARETGQALILGVVNPWMLAVPLVDLGTGEGNPCAEALVIAPKPDAEQEKGLILEGIESTRGAGEWLREQIPGAGGPE